MKEPTPDTSGRLGGTIISDRVVAQLLQELRTGRYAGGVMTTGFDKEPEPDGSWVLPGVVSRKKQFIPAMMEAYQEL